MIDHLVGKPSPSWKRTQVFLVILFWLYRILKQNPGGPRWLWLRKANRTLQRFTPWQLIVSTLTGVYAIRNLDKILGLGSPEPLARLYSPSYYRATWINTGLDAGFATAMSIRPKWLNDLCSVMFSVYYIIYANEADEKLRRFRAVPTVEMLRTTWEKTTNPYIRFFTHLRLPRTSIRRKILLPRPKSSTYQRPITAYLFFAPPEEQLSRATDLILDFPGGGFVAMTPEHHEERLRMWALRTGKPILAIEYGKAPEYPYPFAIDEAFDTYRMLVDSAGTNIGMSGRKFNVIMTGDSAGATLAVSVMIKILEHNATASISLPVHIIPSPLAIVLNYAALDFNFTSWMSPANLRVLRSEQSSGNLPGLKELAMQKDHLGHVSPLSMVGDKRPGRHGKSKLKRRSSWRDTIRGFAGSGGEENDHQKPKTRQTMGPTTSAPSTPGSRVFIGRPRSQTQAHPEDGGALADAESEDLEEADGDFKHLREEDRPIQARVRHVYPQTSPRGISPPVVASPSVLEQQQQELSAAVAEADSKVSMGSIAKEKAKGKEGEPIGTRLTMTSRTGYFQDRVISPSMMRAMAILYIGPHRNPDFATDYHISPILAPGHLLSQFPPLLMQCGEKDPFVDDTVIFAGRVREAKRARKIELDLAIAGKSARFGEGLRMSVASAETPAPAESVRLANMKKERDQLAQETEEDWVQMVLFSEWSHGYLQMPTLMSEAKAVIEDLADWMDEAFWRFSSRWDRRNEERPSLASTGLKLQDGGRRGSSSTKHPPRLNAGASSSKTAPSPFTSETETDDSAITFVPRRRRSTPPQSTEDKNTFLGSSTGNFTEPPRQGTSWSDETLRDDNVSQHHHSSSPHEDLNRKKARTLSSGSRDGATDPETPSLLSIDGTESSDSKVHRGTPGRGTPAGKTAGQTISETELMRRRRLLDSHIFEN